MLILCLVYRLARLPTLLALMAITPLARADRTDDYLKTQMDQRRIPGLALTVVKEGKRIKTGTYGLANVELKVPVTENTVFEIGSLTKQFTAAGILLLAQERRLSVDDPLSRHLRGIPDSWTNITVRHLLTHTSGIKSYTSLEGFELTRHLGQEKFIQRFADLPLEFPPGAGWKYCNTGFNLLGFIIENVSGQSYWRFMTERVFGPLRMDATVDRRPGAIIPNRAAGYEQTNHVWVNREYDLTDIFAAGAIASTIGDLAKWNAALDDHKLLSPASCEMMWTPATLLNGKSTNYGFGWRIESTEGHRTIGHSGSTSGFSATLQRFPEDKLAIIILTNTDEQIATTLAKHIATFYFRE